MPYYDHKVIETKCDISYLSNLKKLMKEMSGKWELVSTTVVGSCPDIILTFWKRPWADALEENDNG